MRCLAVLVILLAACGDDGVRHITDAPPAPIDAPEGIDGALPPPVTVTVSFAGAVQPGLNVFFTNADGSPVATQVTDATGTASQEMAAGGSVTVVAPTPILPGIVRIPTQSPTLYTYAGVKPGDELLLQTAQPATPTSQVSFALTTPVFTGATQYTAQTYCHGLGGGGELATPDGSAVLFPNGTVFMPAGCTTADLLATALDNTGTVLATLYHPALTVTQDQSVDLSAETFTASTTATFTYTNAPGSTVSAQFQRVVASGFGVGNSASAALENESGTVAMTEPALASSEVFVSSSYFTTNNLHSVADWGGTGGDYTLDFTGQGLVEFSDTPAFDLTADKLTWTPSATGVMPDFVSASLEFEGDAAIGQWNIAAPYTGGSIQLPPLVGYVPAATDTVPIQQLMTAKVPGGYDAVRAGVFAILPLGAGLAPGRALLDAYQAPVPEVTKPHVVKRRTRH